MSLSLDGLDADERRIVENVERYDTHVAQISPDHGGDAEFSFTIGLQYRFDHPELIVFGQKPEWQHSLLNSLREEIRAGVRFERVSVCTDVLEGFRLTFRAVPDEQLAEYFGYALWYYRRIASDRGPLRALQVVWPDRADVLPWESGYDAGYAQPILDGTAHASPVNAFPVFLSSGVFVCERVRDGAPVLFVSRDRVEDGDDDWQFLCGALHENVVPGDEVRWGHLRHVLEADEGLNAVADLEADWVAEREAQGSLWVRSSDSEPE